jgi:hypothetical protein
MEIEIKLNDLKTKFPILENAFTQEFAEKFLTVESWHGETVGWPHRPYNPNQSLIKIHWEKMVAAYYQLLKTVGAEDQINPPKNFDNTNFYLNKLHRVFTTALEKKTVFDKKIESSEKILGLINQINDSCHMIEPEVMNDTLKNYLPKKISAYELHPNPQNKSNLIVCTDHLDLITQDADIFAVKHITGKDFMTAYFNEDTANSWDVNNAWITYPSFLFDLDHDIRNFWKSKDFNDWLQRHNYDGPIGYIPIAKLDEMTKNILKIMLKQDSKSFQLQLFN